MNKLICEACGNSFPADSEFCPFCGTKKKATCPSCGQYRIEIGSFCPFCGSAYDGTKPVTEPISIEKEAAPAPKRHKKRSVALVAAIVLLAVLNVVQLVSLLDANDNVAELEKKLKPYLDHVVFAENDGRNRYHHDFDCATLESDYYICSVSDAVHWGYSPCIYCCG